MLTATITVAIPMEVRKYEVRSVSLLKSFVKFRISLSQLMTAVHEIRYVTVVITISKYLQYRILWKTKRE